MSTTELQSTRTLLTRMRSGDDHARDELARRCLPLLQRWARGRLPRSARDLADTDDLVQVSLMRALDNVERFDHTRPGAFMAYLRTILLNASRDEVRKFVRTPTREELAESEPDQEPSPFEKALDAESRAVYESALQSLSEAERNAVILRLEFGMTFQEVALELERPSSDAVRMMVKRALKKMAGLMSPEAGDD